MNKRYLKHLAAMLLSPLLRFLNGEYYSKLKTKMLFSPLYHIVRCNECGYGVYDRKIELELVHRYYKKEYWQSGGMPRSSWHQESLYREDIRAVGQYNLIKEKIKGFFKIEVLEIGAAGALLSRLLRENHEGEVSLSVVESGQGWKEYYAENSIELLSEIFPFETNRKFDYIHTSHWLEHVYNLDEALKQIKKCLKTGGLLFIEVPNCHSGYFNLDIGDAPHIHFFTAKCLCLLLKKYGFTVLSIGEYGLTCEEENIRRNFNTLDEQIIEQGRASEKENIPRRYGQYLRGLFELTG